MDGLYVYIYTVSFYIHNKGVKQEREVSLGRGCVHIIIAHRNNNSTQTHVTTRHTDNRTDLCELRVQGAREQ